MFNNINLKYLIIKLNKFSRFYSFKYDYLKISLINLQLFRFCRLYFISRILFVNYYYFEASILQFNSGMRANVFRATGN
jgi:hypothetical protein